MEDILPYLRVKRNYGPEDAAGKTVVVEDMTGMTMKQAQALLKEQGISAQYLGQETFVTSQLPAAGQTVPGDGQILLYFGGEAEERTVCVPDFTGMDRIKACQEAGKLGLYVLIAGNDSLRTDVVVTGQSVPADTQVAVGTTIRLTFADMNAVD